MQQNIFSLPSSWDALLPQTRHKMARTIDTNDFTAMVLVNGSNNYTLLTGIKFLSVFLLINFPAEVP